MLDTFGSKKFVMYIKNEIKSYTKWAKRKFVVDNDNYFPLLLFGFYRLITAYNYKGKRYDELRILQEQSPEEDEIRLTSAEATPWWQWMLSNDCPNPLLASI